MPELVIFTDEEIRELADGLARELEEEAYDAWANELVQEFDNI